MGYDKRFLPWNDSQLLEYVLENLRQWTDDLIVSLSDDFIFTCARIVYDTVQNYGALSGIASCLEQAKHDKVFITACDIPDIPYSFFSALCGIEADIVMTRDTEKRPEPLLTVYTKRALPLVQYLISNGEKRLSSIVNKNNLLRFGLSCFFYDENDLSWYKNINTGYDFFAASNARMAERLNPAIGKILASAMPEGIKLPARPKA
jgi:molybdopterin-guanine dinucleotide biosynthesis protein A